MASGRPSASEQRHLLRDRWSELFDAGWKYLLSSLLKIDLCLNIKGSVWGAFIRENQSNWPGNQELSFTSYTLCSRRFCIIKNARQWFLDDLAPRNNVNYSVIVEANHLLPARNICLSRSFIHRRLDYIVCADNYNLAAMSWTLDALFTPVFTSNFLCLSCLSPKLVELTG